VEWKYHSNLIIKKHKKLHEIKENLGYTGFIHNFKNYVIRREEHYLISANNQIINSINFLNEYNEFPQSPKEREAILEFKKVVDSYHKKSSSVEHNKALKLPTKELDNIVRVNDTPAVVALNRIKQSIELELSEAKIKSDQLLKSANNRLKTLTYLGIPFIILLATYCIYIVFQLRKSNHNLTSLIEMLPDGFLLTNEAGRIIRSNQRLSEIFGYTLYELENMFVEDLISDKHSKNHKKLRTDFIKQSHIRRMEKSKGLTGVRYNGDKIPLDIAISTIKIGNEHYGIALIKDKREENELRAKSEIDFLTNTQNRMGIDRFLNTEIERSIRYKHKLSLILIDIDHFKQINDQLGHLAGDSIITVVADTLLKSCRPSDVVGRWGGDEFCIVCPETSAEHAYELASRIKNKVNNLKSTAPLLKEMKLSVSIGISEICIDSQDTPEALFLKADQALYKSKEDGRNQINISLG